MAWKRYEVAADLEAEAVLGAMERYGGGFVQALAQCWRCADPLNRERLKAAFPECWETYRRLSDGAS